jgi:hypothetical protein
MTVCNLEKLLSPPHLHGHHPGFHMFAARWKGLPRSSENQLHQAHHSEEGEAPRAQIDAGTHSFEGLSVLMNPEILDNSDHRKKKHLKHLYEFVCLVLHRKKLLYYSQTKQRMKARSEQEFL